MGITKRKFSFSSLRLKTSSPAVEAGTDYDIDTSPPYSPTASEMERPSLHPQLIFDLRQACAIIVNETNPPDPDEEPDHRETMRKFEEERKAKYLAQARAAEVKSQKAEVKLEKLMTRSEQRANEKLQKEQARLVEAEARKAIAREAEPERRKVLERQAELRMGNATNEVKEEPRKEQPQRYSTRRPPEDVPSSEPRSQPQVAVPKQAAPVLESPMTRRKPPEVYRPTMEPLEPTHTRVSAKAKGKRKEGDHAYRKRTSETHSATKLELLPPVHATIVTNTRAKQREAEEPVLNHIRASLHERPKTSAAATVDYDGPSAGSSKSTTRSNTEYDCHGRPTSTAVTSAVLTPGDDQRTSYYRQPSVDSLIRRPSDESYRSEEISTQARAWQEQKAILRLAEEKYKKSGRAARPGSKASKRSRRWGSDNDLDDDRPVSRAGSLSESIRSGISNWARPRASQDSMRSGRTSASGFSRPQSRSSSMSRRNSTGWWRGGSLRRKGSWSSFRSTRGNDEPSKLRKNGEPNLNRPLPALPGLDQYKETKMHIGQLMKGGTRGRKKEKTPRPDVQYPLQQQETQQPAQTQRSRHVKKDSISDPVLRNSSMERTLHRYRESKIMQDSRQPSTSQTRLGGSPHRTTTDHLETIRKDSDNSISYSLIQRQQQDQELPRSQSRQDQPLRSQSSQSNPRSQSRLSQSTSIPLKSPKHHRTSSNSNSNTRNLAKSPPPMIRGPSYQKEIEEGVYPRPMDVNKGPGVEQSKGGMYIHEVITPSMTLLEGLSGKGEGERKGGLKGRVGRIFGGKDARVVDNKIGRRTVAA